MNNHRLNIIEKVIQSISTAQGKQKTYDRTHAGPCQFQVMTYISILEFCIYAYNFFLAGWDASAQKGLQADEA